MTLRVHQQGYNETSSGKDLFKVISILINVVYQCVFISEHGIDFCKLCWLTEPMLNVKALSKQIGIKL